MNSCDLIIRVTNFIAIVESQKTAASIRAINSNTTLFVVLELSDC
jgi:hypothetical protein